MLRPKDRPYLFGVHHEITDNVRMDMGDLVSSCSATSPGPTTNRDSRLGCLCTDSGLEF